MIQNSPDTDPSLFGLRVRCEWSLREYDRRSHLWVPVWRKRNVFTQAGLTGLASALGGSYAPPEFLIIDQNLATVANAAGIAASATSVQLSSRVDLVGDSAITLGVGLAGQESVPFSSVSGSGPYTYVLSSPTAFAHALNEPVVRTPTSADSLSVVVNELSLDPTNAPTARVQASAGYSQGVGNWTVVFYVTGIQALGYHATIGMSENGTLGEGSLHNILAWGYNHVSGTDVEIDGSLTLSNA